MEDRLVHQLEMLSSEPSCGLFIQRVAADLASIRRDFHGEARARLECAAARILGRQLAVADGGFGERGDLADTLYEIVLRLAPDDGMRH